MKKKNLLKIFLITPILLGVFSCTNESKGLISTNKTQYKKFEDIYIKAKGDGNSWVGIYRESDDINKVDSIRWYYVNKNGFVSDKYYNVTKSLTYNSSRDVVKNMPSFKYKAILFSNDTMDKKDYSKYVLDTYTFEVLEDKITIPNAPTNVEYILDDVTSGTSNGTIELTFDDIPVNEVVMYWANDKGVLEDYTSLRIEKVYTNPCTIKLDDDSIIPKEASKLVVYSKNSAGKSASYSEFNLPNLTLNALRNDEKSSIDFEVVSDIHIALEDTHLASSDAKTLHTEHLKEMLKDFENVNKGKSTNTIVVGDIANSGSEREWEEANSLITNSSIINNVYYSLGNHDLYGGSYDNQVNYFYKYSKQDSVYYKVEIDGYTHVFLGSENSDSSVDAYISDEQLTWFDNVMKEENDKDPNKPVFVYLHQSLYNTIAGSLEGQGWNGVTQDSALRNIIEKYKQIFFFNGHSHWDMNSERNHYKKDNLLPNIFNTASVAYLWDSYNIPTGEYLKGSQGYYLKVYDDCIYVLGRDFVNKKFISSACYKIKL